VKFVFRPALSIDNVPPTICFTEPVCRSIQGLKRVMMSFAGDLKEVEVVEIPLFQKGLIWLMTKK
jgi:hypothetical protein